MGLEADFAFGCEPVSVGNVSVKTDVTALAEKLSDAMRRIECDAVHEVSAMHPAINVVLTSIGLPEIAEAPAAYKLAQAVIGRALDLKKEACSAWASADELALLQDSLV